MCQTAIRQEFPEANWRLFSRAQRSTITAFTRVFDTLRYALQTRDRQMLRAILS
jgi:hypothetical protein